MKNIICNAIQNRKIIEITYEGHKRIVEEVVENVTKLHNTRIENMNSEQ